MSKANSDNGDMWAECWKLILSKKLRIDVIKIPRSHATTAMVEAGIISERDRIGNGWAGQYAEQGAALTPATADQIQESIRMQYRFRYIQKRLAHASIIHNDRPNGTLPRANPPPPPIPKPRAPKPRRRWPTSWTEATCFTKCAIGEPRSTVVGGAAAAVPNPD